MDKMGMYKCTACGVKLDEGKGEVYYSKEKKIICFYCPIEFSPYSHELIQWFKDNCYPTKGRFPYKLWQWSNRLSSPPKDVVKFMMACGYIPWAGYPLVRMK